MYERGYLERTIATVRNHRGAENCWPQWANIFADEIERLWAENDQLRANQRTGRTVHGDDVRTLADDVRDFENGWRRGDRWTQHEAFARCPGCGHATVGLTPPYDINHAADCPEPLTLHERVVNA